MFDVINTRLTEIWETIGTVSTFIFILSCLYFTWSIMKSPFLANKILTDNRFKEGSGFKNHKADKFIFLWKTSEGASIQEVETFSWGSNGTVHTKNAAVQRIYQDLEKLGLVEIKNGKAFAVKKPLHMFLRNGFVYLFCKCWLVIMWR